MLRAFLSPFLVVVTVLLISSVEKTLIFLPLIFALSVALVNFRKLKVNNKFFGVFLSVVQSYAVFFGLGIVIYFFDEILQDISFITESDSGFKGILLVTFGGYLASLLLFYFFTFLLRVDNKRFSYIMITIFYIVIVLVMQVFSKNEFLQFGVEKFTSFLISWIIFMSLAFSISLNRTELMSFVEKRK